MSQDMAQLVNMFKQLLKQLDTKFALMESNFKKIESLIGTQNNHLMNEIQSIKDLMSNGSMALEEIDSTKSPGRYLQTASPTKSSQRDLKSISSPLETPSPVLESNYPTSEPISTITSQYGGLKATPLVDAFKEEGSSEFSDSGSLYENSKRKKAQQETLKGYLEKLDSVILKTWPQAEKHLENEELVEFVDKGLTVLHGIIEYIFVAFRNEFSDLEYYEKAKNLSGLGLFKDVSLLEKMESMYNQIQNNETPIMAKPLLRGWHERISKIFKDYKNKKK